MLYSELTMNKLRNIKILTVLSIALSVIVALFSIPPIAQDIDYHIFSDQREYLGIPNFWNVLSNFPFTLVGLLGLLYLRRNSGTPELRHGYIMFFAGVFLVGLGSGYYHLNPNNQTLVWDRLPMAVSFMAFFSVIVGEYIDNRFGRWISWPLVLIGISSVIFWYLTELRGAGDLRPYIAVQFLPALLIAVILLLYKSTHPWQRYIWAVLGAYGVAKVVEIFDARIFSFGGIISGHTLKHLVAALGAYLFLVALKKHRQGTLNG
jgi:hypothetical protein